MAQYRIRQQREAGSEGLRHPRLDSTQALDLAFDMVAAIYRAKLRMGRLLTRRRHGCCTAAAQPRNQQLSPAAGDDDWQLDTKPIISALADAR
jgi:hypothetical protein